MKVKRLLLVFMILIAVSILLTSCNENEPAVINNETTAAKNPTNETATQKSSEAEHIHTFSDWETSLNATCTSEGTKKRICTGCDFSEYIQIPAIGHTEIIDAAIPSTCINIGKTEGKHCGVCNSIIIPQNDVPANGHQYDNGTITTTPTRQKDGKKTYTCTVTSCKHSYAEAVTFSTYSSDAFKTLTEFIITNGYLDDDTYNIKLVDKETETTVITFNTTENYVSLTCLCLYPSEDVSFFAGLSFKTNFDSCYFATYRYVRNILKNEISGTFDKQNITNTTILEYDYYNGESFQESIMQNEASSRIIYLVDYLRWVLENYTTIELSDLGFDSFSKSSVNNNTQHPDNNENDTNNSYAQYQNELQSLTNQYNSEVNQLESKIADCLAKIEETQAQINYLKRKLSALSPEPSASYIQSFLNNWQIYGNTYAATEAAKESWKKQYNEQYRQLNNSLSLTQTTLSGHQGNLSLYCMQLEVLSTEYNMNVTSLKAKYGIK